MKSKLGISLLICTVILSSSPLPIVAEELVNPKSDQQTTESNDLQPTIDSESLNTKKIETTISDEIVTEQSTTQEITDTTNEEQTEETQESTSDPLEENEAPIEDREYADDEFVFSDSLQQEIRDAAMASGSTLSRSNHVSSFIQRVAPHATKIANQYNLYASVMIAQAALESDWGRSTLGKEPNNNLFGIKGSYNGQSVTMQTWEVIDGKVVWINAKFRKYPSPLESMEDNAKLLRGGISGAPDFYNGTWKERTKSYEDATKWLTGRYATDPDYASKLNATIRANNLTKYDYAKTNPNNQTITSNIAVNKGMKIKNTAYNVYTQPYNTANSFSIGTLNFYSEVDKRVVVSRYATTSQGVKTYYINNIGWVDERALADYATIKTKTDKNLDMRLKNTGYYIYNLPFGTDGSVRGELLSSKYSNNQQVKVTSEVVTSTGVRTYYIDKIGWVDHRALMDMPTYTTPKTENQPMRIADNNYYFYNLPYNTLGAVRGKQIKTTFGINKQVTPSLSSTTSQGVNVYYLEGLGWIDKRALRDMPTYTSIPQNKEMKVLYTNYNFYNKPFNTLNAEKTELLSKSLATNDIVKVTEYATTSQGVKTYLVSGKGWVDERALKNIPTYQAQTVNKKMRLRNINYYFYTTPFETSGSKRIAQIKDRMVLNQQVDVTKFAKTSDGIETYYIAGQGWVDARALIDMPTANEEARQLDMRVANTNYYLYNAPYNTLGAERQLRISDKLAKHNQIRVTRYAKTSQGVETYYIKDFGWVDTRALKNVASFTESSLNKRMTIINGNYYLYNKPYNTNGAERTILLKTKLAVNSSVQVTKSAVTSEGVKVFFIQNYGWVDARALK